MLKLFNFGGEVLSPKFYERLTKYTNAKIYDGYGPSETTSCCSCKYVTSSQDINLGKPLPNVNIYICNKDLNLCPIGITGELCISGDGVSYGYINNVEATNKNFVKNPFGKGLLYKSGDLAKWNSNGDIEYVGRNDFQIKIRGLRVELEEINNAIKSLPEINNSVTIVRKINNIDSICSFVVPTSYDLISKISEKNKMSINENGKNSKDEKRSVLELIKRGISKVLPNYMVPSHIVLMESLPLTTNGKIDTKNLPEIKSEITYVAPKTDTQKLLASIFEEFLNVPNVSIDANFFELGGDSLIAIKIITKLSSDFGINISMKDIFACPIISNLSDLIDLKQKNNSDIFKNLKDSEDLENLKNSENLEDSEAELSNSNTSTLTTKVQKSFADTQFKKAENQEAYPVSSAQKRIYYTMQMDPNSLAYNTPGGIIFDNPPDVKKLEKSINILIQKHESFRTYFVMEDGEVKQKILENYKFSLPVSKGSYTDLDDLFKAFLKPFDLSKAPLFRAEFVKFENNKSILFIDFHHSICDGSSISIFTDELCKLYNGETLKKTDFDYKDYALWEKEYFDSNLFKSDEKYWLSRFSHDIPVLAMPSSFERPSTFSFEGNKLSGEIANTKKIYEVCNILKTTPYIFMLSIYYILLYKYTNQDEIVVGTPVAGRNIKETNDIIGMFVNTLALKNKIDSSKTFKEFLKDITSNCLEAFEHQAYPFDKLIEKLEIARDTSRNPLFDTMFVFQNEGNPKLNFGKIDTSFYAPDNNTSKFDFLLEVVPCEDSFKLNLEYCNKIYAKIFMEDFLIHYINIVNAVLSNTDKKISEIYMLSNFEKNEILNTYKNNSLEYPHEKSIIELFEEQADKTPNAVAILYKDEKLTYKDLKEKVNNFSYYLYKRGVKKGEIVGTLLDRSSNLIISMLAIMKCGCVYLPISKEFPQDRIDYIIKNSKLNTIITDSSYTGFHFEQDVVNIDLVDISYNFANCTANSFNDSAFNRCTLSPDDPIYSIYTSGSTGNPKGVLVTNRNLNNFISSFNKLFNYSVGNNDICLASTNICFDVSIWEFFFCLLNGATLYLYSNDTIEDIFDFCNTLIEKNITTAYLPPNILNEVYAILSQNSKKVKLQKILIGVEPIKTATISKYFSLNPDMQIVNGYGPTETTICSTAFVVTPSNCNKYNIVPIGKPIFNLNAYILDKDLNIVPKGVPGELYIVGDNVTKGYLHNKKLTESKYIKSPFDENKIMYSTGDVVKMLPDGNIAFVGRNDSQVKFNGHRIELSEIANSILSYPSITKCMVLVREQNGNKSLVAFFTADKKVILNDLRSFLSLKLPFYSVPNRFMQLDKFVLTSNGKIDKKYLNSIELTDENNYEAPRNNFERQLVELWEEFLNVNKVGITDNFFDLGGDSLIAIRLQIQAFKLGLNISYADIFSNPTIKQLSEKVAIRSTNIDISNYDYTKIDRLLNVNTLPISGRFKKKKLQNVLLTGSTGFVGIHILDKLLSNTKANIYCLVRNKNNVSYINRLYKTLQFYFGHKYDKLVGSRIKILQGDITDKNLGLPKEKYEKLGNKLSCIINSAAIVKHYGKSSEFDKINIEGVENIISFCKEFDIKLYHLSTLSVSGNVFAEDSFSGGSVKEKTVFKENNLYIHQDISNIYVYTKFMAERIILENVEKGDLKATIIRLGNITNRYSDGKFQINISENAFLNRLLTFIKLGCIPDYLLEGYCEFTPVDFVADAITKIAMCYPDKYSVLHLYNNNHVPMPKLISILNKYGLDVKVLPEKEFLEVVDNALNTDENILSGIINDFDTNKKLIYDSNIVLDNDFTNEFLAKLSFRWCKIGKTYLFRYLNYLKDLGYLK